MTDRAVATSKTYRFTFDVQAELYAEPGDLMADTEERSAAHHRALIEALMARPDLLDHLLRSSAIDALGRAQEKLSTQQWDGASEQDLLRQIAKELNPEVTDYLLEEVEDGATVLLFDSYGASVRRLYMEMIRNEQGDTGT